MKTDILEEASMASAQNKPVPVKPFRISGVVPHHMPVQNIPNFGHAKRHSRVPSLGGLHCVHDQHPNIIHALHVN